MRYKRLDFYFDDIPLLSLNDKNLMHRKEFKEHMNKVTYKIKKKKFENFWIDFEYNNNFDVDNCIIIVKLFVDSLKDNHIIKDDNNQVFTSLKMSYNSFMPTGSFSIYLYYISRDNIQTVKKDGKKRTNTRKRA